MIKFIKNLEKFKNDVLISFRVIDSIIKQDYSKFNFAFVNNFLNQQQINTLNVWDLNQLFDGFFWATQKNRRSVEKRLKMKFGHPRFTTSRSLLKLKHDLIICESCGNWHEVKNICQTCYLKVKKETNLIQEAIIEKLKLRPVEKEIKYFYEDDKKEDIEDDYLVEIPKQRPSWFTQNLISHPISNTVNDNRVATDDNEIKVTSVK